MGFGCSRRLCHAILTRKLFFSFDSKVGVKIDRNAMSEACENYSASEKNALPCNGVAFSNIAEKPAVFDGVTINSSVSTRDIDGLKGAAIKSSTKGATSPESQAISAENKEEEMSLFSFPVLSPESLQEDVEHEINPSEKAKYIFLAYKALLWGTFYSILGVGILTVGVMAYFNLYSVSEVLEKVRRRRDKYVIPLKRTDNKEIDSTEGVKHFDLDFQDAQKAWEQIKEIWLFVEQETAK